FGERGKELMREQFHLTVLALSKEGYENLVAWSSDAMQREHFYRKPRISIFRMAEIAPWPLHHNVVLSGCLGSELNQALLAGSELGPDYIEGMKSIFPNFYIELQDHWMEKFQGQGLDAYDTLLDEEEMLRGYLVDLAQQTGTPMVFTNDSHMQRPSDRKAHVAMKASAYRNRDDSHYGTSQEKISVAYLKDYAYYGNYMRDMEKAGGAVP